MKTINIKCDVKHFLPIEKMLPFQGDLKDLMEIDYQKLKKSITKQGFIAPFFLWHCQDDDQWYLLDGHQRKKTLEKMKSEGWQIPEMPYVEIKADSYEQAKQNILYLSSAFGTMTSQGLYEFVSTANLDFNDLQNYRLPEINMDKFAEEFGDLPSVNEGAQKEKKEVPPEEDQYIVSVNCQNENEMQELYEELKERGFECKLIT